jgi:hypothetical protein
LLLFLLNPDDLNSPPKISARKKKKKLLLEVVTFGGIFGEAVEEGGRQRERGLRWTKKF